MKDKIKENKITQKELYEKALATISEARKEELRSMKFATKDLPKTYDEYKKRLVSKGYLPEDF